MKELQDAKSLAIKAGDLLISGTDSPDLDSNRIILEGLVKNYPNYGIISEESESINSDARNVWLIDPLDGSKEYLLGKSEYTITMALLVDRVPKLAVVYRPTTRDMYCSFDGQSYKNDELISVGDETQMSKAKLLVSASEYKEQYLRNVISDMAPGRVEDLGSTALKICMVAEGSADMYLSFTSKDRHIEEWDYLAAKMILENASGRFIRKEANIPGLDKMLIGTNGLISIR